LLRRFTPVVLVNETITGNLAEELAVDSHVLTSGARAALDVAAVVGTAAAATRRSASATLVRAR
jgi:hypothetical protein